MSITNSPESVQILSPYRETGEEFQRIAAQVFEDYSHLVPQAAHTIFPEPQRSYWLSSKHTAHVFTQSKDRNKSLFENAEQYNADIASIIELLPQGKNTLTPLVKGVIVLPDKMKGEDHAQNLVVAKLKGPDGERVKNERDILLASVSQKHQGLNIKKVRQNSIMHVTLFSTKTREVGQEIASYFNQNITDSPIELKPVELDTVTYLAKLAVR